MLELVRKLDWFDRKTELKKQENQQNETSTTKMNTRKKIATNPIELTMKMFTEKKCSNWLENLIGLIEKPN